ncbi:porin [Undibacterium griseum]|uniref:Porin n=1 Tax=Undibacterium griseum TaxID=2762295 RepID=A0ABR6YQY9_9BURK|nr:porin [Undibacterium griseum]MBC3886195.1 porin [Undibacterium griseum]
MFSLLPRFFIFAFCTLISLTALADDSSNFSITGFGTIGVVHNTTSDADIIRDLSQNTGTGHTRQNDINMDSNLGLQADAHLNDVVDAAVQVVSRYGPNEYKPEVTWAYAKYSPNDTVQLRLGRLGFDVYLLADSRNIGYSYTWVRPPIDFFGNLIVSYFDGFDTTISRDLGHGQVRLKFFSGMAREKVYNGIPNQFFSLNGSRLTGGHVEYQQGNWTFRLGHSQLRFANENPVNDLITPVLNSPAFQLFYPGASQLSQKVLMQDKNARYTSLGIVYDKGPLQAQLMLSRINSGSLFFPGSDAAYLSASYRVKNWTPYVTYSGVRPSGERANIQISPQLPPEIQGFLQALSTGLNDQLSKQNTITAGVRYDLSENVSVKVQLDHIRSQDSFLIRNDLPNWNGRATLLSLAVNFIF